MAIYAFTISIYTPHVCVCVLSGYAFYLLDGYDVFLSVTRL